METKANLVSIQVSKAALLARINRALAKENERLYAPRSARAEVELGFHVIRFRSTWDEPSTNIVQDHVDPEDLARELGVLKDYERLEG